jgi:ribose transport system substrate-binding protein
MALSRSVLRADAAASSARFHLIVAVPDTDDSYFRGLLEGINDATKGAEAAVQVFRYAAASEQEASRCFDLAVRARVDGLIMYTSRNDPLGARAAEASRAGVTFIPVCTDPPTAKGQFFVGTDSLRHGFESASIALAKLGASARIGVILPSSGSAKPEDEPFFHGVSSATKVYPGAKVEAIVRARPGPLTGEESAASMLRRGSPVNAIICPSAKDTVGAAQVVIDMNKVGKVLIVGTDESPDIRRYVDNGVVTASIVRDSVAIGRAAVKAFTAMRSGQKKLDPLESGFSIYQAAEKSK